MKHHYHIDSVLCKHKKYTYLNLITRWADLTQCKNFLKTDLFEESVGQDDLLFDLAGQVQNAVGMDISPIAAIKTTERARRLKKNNIGCVCCDVRKLPFQSNSFDVIVSGSTLDHFNNQLDIYYSLEELWRILEPGGTLILTMDNKSNWSDLFFRLWIKAGIAPYFSGNTYSIKEANDTLRQIGFDVTENTSIIHNPRLVTRWLVGLLSLISPAKSSGWIWAGLNLLDKLEHRKTKYLTGLYIAVKAVKLNKQGKTDKYVY